MDEQKAKTEAPKIAATNIETGVQSYSSELIRHADEAREGLRVENERMEKNIKELRELTARNILGGQTQSGQTSKEPEISPKDYAKMLLEGKLKFK